MMLSGGGRQVKAWAGGQDRCLGSIASKDLRAISISTSKEPGRYIELGGGKGDDQEGGESWNLKQMSMDDARSGHNAVVGGKRW